MTISGIFLMCIFFPHFLEQQLTRCLPLFISCLFHLLSSSMAQHMMVPQNQPAPATISQLTHKIPIFYTSTSSSSHPRRGVKVSQDANEVFEAEGWWGGDCLMSVGGRKVLAVPWFLNYPQLCRKIKDRAGMFLGPASSWHRSCHKVKDRQVTHILLLSLLLGWQCQKQKKQHTWDFHCVSSGFPNVLAKGECSSSKRYEKEPQIVQNPMKNIFPMEIFTKAGHTSGPFYTYFLICISQSGVPTAPGTQHKP